MSSDGSTDRPTGAMEPCTMHEAQVTMIVHIPHAAAP